MPEDRTKLKSQIVYADGTFAIFENLKEIEVETNGINEKYIEFILRPTLKARIKWGIKEISEFGFIDKGEYMGWYKKKYPRDWCRPLDLSPDSAVWILSCDYKGKYIDLYGGEVEIWKEKNQFLKKKIRVLTGIINGLAYEMAKKSTNPMAYLKKMGKDLRGVMDDIAPPIIAGQVPTGGGHNE